MTRSLLDATRPFEGRDRGRYVAFNCPSCQKRGRAYAYHKNASGSLNTRGFWRCNRPSCGASGHLFERKQALIGAKRTGPRTEELRDLTPLIRPALGRLSSRARRYLTDRLPGADLQGLRSFIIDPSKSRGDVERLGRQGWELCALLHAIDDPGRVASLQGRFVLGDERLENLWGPKRAAAPKIRSLKGAYGSAGATFGRLDKALEAAKKEKSLVVVEGLIDFLTARASGLRAVVGVPGLAFAQKLARHLKERGWSGRLVLSLDGDEAGAASLLKVLEELETEPEIEVFNGRPLDDKDLNDVYREGGSEAVHALIRDARIAPRPLLLPTIKRSKTGKERARELYGRHRENSHSALRALGWSGCCGIVIQERRRFRGTSRAGQVLSKRPRLCEGKSCSYCRSKTWPKIVEKLRERWPSDLRLALVELEDNNPEEVGKLRRRLSQKTSKLRKELGGSYLTASDPIHARLVLVADSENPELLEALESELKAKLISVSLEEVLEHLKWAYMGPAIQAAERLESDEDLSRIEADPWLSKRSRWASAVGQAFRLPSSKELEFQAEDDGDTRPIREPERVEFDLYFSSVGKRIAAVTIEPLPRKALMPLIQGEPLGLLSPGLFNLLEYPDELGPEGRSWLEDLLGDELPGRGRAPEGDLIPAALKATYYDRRDQLHRIERILRGVVPRGTGPP